MRPACGPHSGERRRCPGPAQRASRPRLPQSARCPGGLPPPPCSLPTSRRESAPQTPERHDTLRIYIDSLSSTFNIRAEPVYGEHRSHRAIAGPADPGRQHSLIGISASFTTLLIRGTVTSAKYTTQLASKARSAHPYNMLKFSPVPNVMFL